MDERHFKTAMDSIVSALREQGYDPYDQLRGYIETRDPVYITRHRDARNLIQTLDVEDIAQYIRSLN